MNHVIGQENITREVAGTGSATIAEDDSAAEDVSAAGVTVRAGQRRIAGVLVGNLRQHLAGSADRASVNEGIVVLARHDERAVVGDGRTDVGTEETFANLQLGAGVNEGPTGVSVATDNLQQAGTASDQVA